MSRSINDQGTAFAIVAGSLLRLLVATTAFCCFGFLATFEPPRHLPLRWTRGSVAVAWSIAIVAVWLARPKKLKELKN
jgi:hypothetical protein